MNIRSLATAATLALALASTAVPASAFENGDVELQGTVTSFDGHDDLHVRDANGNVHDVQLHPGTIINPEGLTLANGMTVTILGTPAGDTFDVNEIDTSYVNDGSTDPTYDGGPSFGGGVSAYSYGYQYGYGSPYGNRYPNGSGYPYGNGYPYGYGSGNPYVYGYPVSPRPGVQNATNPRPSTLAPTHQFAPQGRRVPFSAAPRTAPVAPVMRVAPPAVSHAAPSAYTRR